MKAVLNRVIVILGFLTFFYIVFKKDEKVKSAVKDLKKSAENFDFEKVENKVRSFVNKEVERRVPGLLDSFKDTPIYEKVSKKVNNKKVAKRSAKKKNPSGVGNVNKLEDLNERQLEILEALKKRKELSMSDIAWIFPNVSQRTLRRDFDKLESLARVEQIGKTKNSKYVLKNP